MNIPTKITILRIVMIPVFILLWYLPILGEMTFLSLKSLVLTAFFIFLSLTDWLDGYIARKYNLITDLGKFLDPIADKILVFSVYFLLLNQQVIDPISLIIMMSREFIVSAIRMVAASTGVIIAADWSGKVKTVVQMVSIITLLLMFQSTSNAASTIVYGIYWLSVILTALSGIQYTVNYLQEKRKI
ncbi:phosphatidylglycerophosphate synthetase [Erysipelotrichaceae bacterium]|nr:phosphatidylglycerophosphate synthetase [Erysipelotrichaceae bacterium]